MYIATLQTILPTSSKICEEITFIFIWVTVRPSNKGQNLLNYCSADGRSA